MTLKRQFLPSQKTNNPPPKVNKPASVCTCALFYAGYFIIFSWSRKPHFDHLPVLCMVWVSITDNDQNLWGETLTYSSTSLTWYSLKRLLKLFNYGFFFFMMSLTDLWHHPWSLECLFTLWICLCFIVLLKAIPPSSPETKHFLLSHILVKCQLVLKFSFPWIFETWSYLGFYMIL